MENYHLRVSDFNVWKLKGLRDYSERTFPDDSFKVRWRGTVLTACHIVFPILTAVGIGFATTLYLEKNYKEIKFVDSIKETVNLENFVQEINLKD